MCTQNSIHIYLGPSLDLHTAKQILPDAVYHPPIRCGDLLRLKRLSPQHAIIIDGFYETTPSVWHKEILFVMELGVHVWGAASIGALRAAELYQFGMHGLGKVFNAFKDGLLTDDDEVAVLHQDLTGNFCAINDAMVNIRETCDELERIFLISSQEKELLIQFCKKQFYPYRSLRKAIFQFGSSQIERYDVVMAWLSTYGLIDIKRLDAIDALEQVKKYEGNIHESTQYTTPKTYYFNEIKTYAELTPFETDSSLLPSIERELKQLYATDKITYALIAEIAFFSKKMSLFLNLKSSADIHLLREYIEHHNLYDLSQLPLVYQEDHLIFPLICQMICKYNITDDLLKHVRPMLMHYYCFFEDEMIQHENKLHVLMMLILCVSAEVKRLSPKGIEKNVYHHLTCLKTMRGYTSIEFDNWLNPTHLDAELFYTFLSHYAQAYLYMPDCTRSKDNWIHQVFSLFFK